MLGNFSDELKEALLETMQVEFTVIDANDKIVGWNKPKIRVFQRKGEIIGNDVRECHPKEKLDKVNMLLEGMKAEKIDKMGYWSEFGTEKKKIWVEYRALRNKEGKYIGCVETNLELEEAEKTQVQNP